MELVPSTNIGGDVGHRKIVGNICEEQIEALVMRFLHENDLPQPTIKNL
jgi:hypothetical protein